jgi:hypothetical protein
MEQTKTKVISRLRLIVTLSCLLTGFLAGENVFRYTMEVPGWRHIDIAQWSEYSRHADLGYGVFLLPFGSYCQCTATNYCLNNCFKKKG